MSGKQTWDDLTLGVEEEFFLVDPDSRDLLADPDPGIFETCERNRGTAQSRTRAFPNPDRDQHPSLSLAGRGTRRPVRHSPAGP